MPPMVSTAAIPWEIHSRAAGNSISCTAGSTGLRNPEKRVMCPRLCGSSRKPVTMEKKARITSGITIAFPGRLRSEEHTSELQSLMRISYAVFCLKKKNKDKQQHQTQQK